MPRKHEHPWRFSPRSPLKLRFRDSLSGSLSCLNSAKMPGMLNVRNVAIVILAFMLPLGAGAQSPPASTKPAAAQVDSVTANDAQAQQGIWKPIAAVLGGSRLPSSALEAITLKITGDEYEVTIIGEKEPDKGTVTLETSTTP